MANENDSSALALFLLGSVVGAAVALLLAPKTGRDTRNFLKESGFQFKKLAEEGLDSGKASADDFIQHGRAFMDEMGERLISAFEAGKEAMKEELIKERKKTQGPPSETY